MSSHYPVVEAGRGGKCVRRMKDGLGLENESVRSVWLTPSAGFSGVPEVQGKGKKDQKPFAHVENQTCRGRKDSRSNLLKHLLETQGR